MKIIIYIFLLLGFLGCSKSNKGELLISNIVSYSSIEDINKKIKLYKKTILDDYIEKSPDCKKYLINFTTYDVENYIPNSIVTFDFTNQLLGSIIITPKNWNDFKKISELKYNIKLKTYYPSSNVSIHIGKCGTEFKKCIIIDDIRLLKIRAKWLNNCT